MTGVGAEAAAGAAAFVAAGLTSFGLSLLVIIFDSSFLGASAAAAAPFDDADDADFVTVKLSVFLVASLVTPDAAVAPDFTVDEAAVADVTFDEVAEEVLLTGGLD